MNEYDLDSQTDSEDNVDLSAEEQTAAAMLGLGSTKRLSKKAYAEFKKKAESIVSKAGVPSKTPRQAAKGIVKGGGQKSAKVSARTFSEALKEGPIKVPSGPVISDVPRVSGKMGEALEKAKRAAAGTSWQPAEGVIDLPGPSSSRGAVIDALSKGGEAALSALKKIGVSPSTLESAGKFVSKGAKFAKPITAVAGPAAAVAGAAAEIADIESAGEDSDAPPFPLSADSRKYASFLQNNLTSEEQEEARRSVKDLLPESTVASSRDSSTSINPLDKQRSTPMYDINTEGDIIKSALAQPQPPEYLKALEKRRADREKYVNFLQNDPTLVDVEKERLLTAYDSKSSEQRALDDAASLTEERDSINQKIAETQSALAATSNQFASDRLNKQLESYKTQLAKLTPEQTSESRVIAESPNEPSAENILSGLEQDADNQPTSSSAAIPTASVAAPITKGIPAGKTATGTGQPTSADVAKQDREEELTKIVGQQAAREMTQYEDLMARFREAQERERGLRLLASAGRAGEKIGAAIAGVKPGDSEFYKSIEDYAGQQLSEFEKEEGVRKEAESRDPNSPMSQEYRGLVESMGVKLRGDESAASLIKAMPFLQQYQSQKENREARLLQAQLQREAIAANKEIALDEKTNKGFVDMTKQITSGIQSARTSFGRSANISRAAGAIEVLASKWKAGELTNTEIQELAKSVDAMLTQGSPTITGTQKLVPQSLVGDWKKIYQYIANTPKGAEQGEFVNRLLGTVAREKQYAKQEILKTQRQLLTGYEHLKKKDPERYNRTLEVFEIPKEEDVADSQKEQPALQAKNPKIQEYANQHTGGDYDKALQILEARKKR